MFKILFILLRHGINPFTPIDFWKKEQMRIRLTDKEKYALINYAEDKKVKAYLRNMLF